MLWHHSCLQLYFGHLQLDTLIIELNRGLFYMVSDHDSCLVPPRIISRTCIVMCMTNIDQELVQFITTSFIYPYK